MIGLAIFIGAGMSGAIAGWNAHKLYLKRLHKMSLYIREVQRGGK